MPVELDGQVHHIAARIEAVGRGVGPTAGHVDAHGRTAPNDLVAIDVETGQLQVAACRLRQPLAQEREGARFVAVAVLIPQAVHLRAEHGVANLVHQRSVCGQGGRKRKLRTDKFLCRIAQIDLIHHAAGVVLGQERQVVAAESAALLFLAHEIGARRDFVGAQALFAAPQGRQRRVGLFGQHPREEVKHLVGAVANGEESRGLQVVGASQLVGGNAAGGQPLADGAAEVMGGGIVHIAAESVVETIGAQHKLSVAVGFDVHTLSAPQVHGAVVHGNAREHMLALQLPAGGEVTVFDPNVLEFGRERLLHARILREDGAVLLHPAAQDEALVFHHVLERGGRTDHLGGGAEVVEFSAREGEHGHGEFAQVFIDGGGMRAEGTTELRIEVVGHAAAVFAERAAAQERNGAVAQQPDAQIHERQVGGGQFVLALDARFLEHEVELLRMVTMHEEHAVIARRCGVGPQAVAHHIGLRHRQEGLGGANIDVAARHQRAQAVGSGRHDALIERKLEREQGLVEALPAGPAKHGDGQQHLAAGRISRQAATLTAGVQQDALLTRQPLVEILDPFGLSGAFEQPRGTAAAAEFAVDGIGGAEIFVGRQLTDGVEAVDDVGRERQQFLHTGGNAASRDDRDGGFAANIKDFRGSANER